MPSLEPPTGAIEIARSLRCDREPALNKKITESQPKRIDDPAGIERIPAHLNYAPRAA
jgi:hypothetical protein